MRMQDPSIADPPQGVAPAASSAARDRPATLSRLERRTMIRA